MEAGGLLTTLVAYTVLYCEWSFRIRRATEEDIEQALNDMVRRLGTPPNGPLTVSQAQLFVNAVEPGLRKQMKGVRIPIIYGFSPETFVLDWDAVPNRRAYTPLVQTRRGSLPVVGPILAGLVTEALWEQLRHEPRPDVGVALCAILLARKIVPVEYAKWKQHAGAFKLWRHRRPGLARELARLIHRSHQQAVEQAGGLSATQLVEQCGASPESVLGRSMIPEVIQRIYTVPWNGAKTGTPGRK
jgi:hypothetical protein